MPTGTDYSPREVAELMRADAVQLIDVRQHHEHTAGRIADSRLIELSTLGSQLESIDRNRPVVAYCRSGARSALAVKVLLGAGFDAHNMAGGIIAWQAAGLPLDPSDGFVAEP